MAQGPGKYDAACTAARELTGGSVLLIVLGGKLGSGFAVQAEERYAAEMPRLLRAVADEIERDTGAPRSGS